MSTDTHTGTVAIGDESYPIPPLTTDKGLRLISIIADAGEELQEVMDRTMAWREESAQRNAVMVTAATFDNPENAAHLEAMGYTRELVAERGEVMVPIYPDETETIMHALPAAFRTLPDVVLNACAIVIAPAGELIDADDAGELDAYLAGWVRKIRVESTPDQFADLVAAVIMHAREQLFGDGGAVGKVMAMVGGLMGRTEEPPKKATPRTKPKPKSSSRSRPPSAGPAAKSS